MISVVNSTSDVADPCAVPWTLGNPRRPLLVSGRPEAGRGAVSHPRPRWVCVALAVARVGGVLTPRLRLRVRPFHFLPPGPRGSPFLGAGATWLRPAVSLVNEHFLRTRCPSSSGVIVWRWGRPGGRPLTSEPVRSRPPAGSHSGRGSALARPSSGPFLRPRLRTPSRCACGAAESFARFSARNRVRPAR